MADNQRILLIFNDPTSSELVERSVLRPEGYKVFTATDAAEAREMVEKQRPHLVVLGEALKSKDALALASKINREHPNVPILWLTGEDSPELINQALRSGIVELLPPPLRTEQVLAAVRRGMERYERWQEWAKTESRRYTGPLLEQLGELERIAEVGRSVTADLHLDGVLTAVVEAAVDLTAAEEGSLLLLDEAEGELYMRAARNFAEDFVRTFRLPAEDSIAGEVLRSGEPTQLYAEDPQKIKTAYLVHSLIYVPLKVKDRVIGVLGVDNRQTDKPFQDKHVTLLSALADYAAVAIENARLYTNTEVERSKLEAILTQVRDGVIIIDREGHPILVNQTVRKAFGLGDRDFSDQSLDKVFKHSELIRALIGEGDDPLRVEVEADEGRVFSVRLTEVPEVGTVATLHDITYLKELDHIKTDFVNTVSHDLRSPLTAILGYVELVERSGEVNERQAEFIRRVKLSVHNITDLINGLLDLGRIEIGLEEDIESVSISPILNYTIEGVQSQIRERGQTLRADYPDELPPVVGNPLHLRQMLDNLLGNASKYTPEGGEIAVRGQHEGGQVILQVADNGPGIPLEEQSRIFEKFYRGSNVGEEVQGTGLGLAIVKSIVDNHRGRIWVDSQPGKGATFTVVLPVAEEGKAKR